MVVSAPLEIAKLPEPCLRKRCEPVPPGPVTDEIRALIDSMWASLAQAEGLGLSANQICRSVRVAVIDIPLGERRFKRVLINPRITWLGPRRRKSEGCLSMPGRYFIVLRADEIEFEHEDVEGETFQYRISGLVAQAVQHETDHLDGYLITVPRRRATP